MADSTTEPSKQSDGWRAVFAASATAICIAICQRKITNKDDLQVALLLAPGVGQLVGFLISWPVQYVFDLIDVARFERAVGRLQIERGKLGTSPKRRAVIDANVEWYQKKIFELESKGFLR